MMALDNIPGSKIFRQRDVRETPTTILTAAEAVPVGAILPWLKSFTGTPSLPTGFVECDGQVLNDADSVYNGETIPDLNGDNRFLRGNATSGATGGSETMAHTHTGTASGTTGNQSSTQQLVYSPGSTTSAGAVPHTHSFSDSFTTSAASNAENRPPYHNVVWIMRVK